MQRDIDLEAMVVAKYAALSELLDERARRHWAATESRAIGYGGDALVAAATGLARATIRKGRLELEVKDDLAHGRVRREGAGRPRLKDTQHGLLEALEALVEPVTRGDATSPLTTNAQMDELPLHPDDFRGEWNYELRPRKQS